MEEEKKVLLVSATNSFMVNAITRNIEKAGYIVNHVQPKVRVFTGRKTDEKVVLIYIDGDMEKLSEFLVYIKDQISDGNFQAHIYLVGSDEEVSTAQDKIGTQNVRGAFLRPLNVKTLVEEMDGIFVLAKKDSDKKHILVVDDQGAELRKMKGLLEGRYHVHLANSGMKAIEFLVKNPVDLILLDYEMPVASGPQVLKMIRSESSTSSTPVMFLTSKSDRESVMNVVDLKPEKYLLKTMPSEAILENIDNFFAEHI